MARAVNTMVRWASIASAWWWKIGVPGVSWTVVKNLSLFEHVRQKVCIMPASKFSKEFKEQIIAEVLEGSRPIAEVAKSYNLVPQTVGNWVRIWALFMWVFVIGFVVVRVG